jgi:hypothetical protein
MLYHRMRKVDIRFTDIKGYIILNDTLLLQF